MRLCGQNLYRVTFKITGGQKVKELELSTLVVAYSEKEAIAQVGASTAVVQVLESDISLLIPNQYIKNGRAEGELQL